MPYDITTLFLRAGSTPRALAALEKTLPQAPGTLLACWSADVGKLNRIMIIRRYDDEAAAAHAREALARSPDWLGAGEFVEAATSDAFVLLPFLPALAAGSWGPFFEVRDYLLKPGVVDTNIERWQKALPRRIELSPVLGCFYSASGITPRWLHIWPYKSLDERHRIRGEAVRDGVWPPPGGGPEVTATQENAIYVPAPWSPIR